MCSCPPFECTCGKWNLQTSPKVAHSPPFAAKRLNFCAPAYCDIASGSGMQSLSIEIDTNKHLRHNNATLSHYQTESCFQTSIQGIPNISVQNPLYYQGKTFDPGYYSSPLYRESALPHTQTGRSCETQDSGEIRRCSKRNRTMFESIHSMEKANNDSEFFDFSSKRIKSESPGTLTDCARPCSVMDGGQSFQRHQSVNYENQSNFFDDSIDLLSSPFETDIYSSLVQRFNETTTTCSEQSQSTVSTSTSNLTELKVTKDHLFRQKACENIAYGSTQRNKNGDSASTVNDPLYSSTSSFPSHSQCMMTDVAGLGQPCSFDYDQRYQPQAPLTSQSNYCNHSINITLRYK